MVNRHRIFIILAVATGVCTSIGIYLFYQHRRRISQSKNRSLLAPVVPLSCLRTSIEPQTRDNDVPASSDDELNDSQMSESINDDQIPGGEVPLTYDQAEMLTRLIRENYQDSQKIYHLLRSIANATRFRESQINLAGAGCVTVLGEIFLLTEDKIIKQEVLSTLTDLALSDFAINQFRNIVSPVIELSLAETGRSSLRSSCLNILMNMSVLSNLHDEYMRQVDKLDSLIRTTIDFDDEALSSGKILVNLSKNRSNLDFLLGLTSVSMIQIIDRFRSSKDEEILKRYLTFYNHIASSIRSKSVRSDDRNNNKPSLVNTTKNAVDSLYYDFFDDKKQNLFLKLLAEIVLPEKLEKLVESIRQTIDFIRKNEKIMKPSD